MKRTTNQGVIEAFVNKFDKDVQSHNGNLRYDAWGQRLINYQTVIAKWENNGGHIWMDGRKFSRTTSKIQTQLRRTANI